MNAVIEDLRRARQVGAPLVGITTQDQPAVVDLIRSTLGVEQVNGKVTPPVPLLCWDVVRGIRAVNEEGKQAIIDAHIEAPEKITPPSKMLVAAQQLPKGVMVLMMNSHMFLGEVATVQALMNLRDQFKTNKRTMVLLAPAFRLPAELTQDVHLIDDPLPTPEQIGEGLRKLYSDNGVQFNDETIRDGTDALRGLAAFPIEQAAALSVRKDKDSGKPVVIREEMWARKRRMLEQVPGLSMEAPTATFDEIGGLTQIKKFMTLYMNGKRRPKVIVLMDEIEKMVAGAGGSNSASGDSSGVSQDAMMVILTEMQDRLYNGLLAVGFAGSGKSLIARAIAATFHLPLLRVDLGAAKGRYVGDSEGMIRAVLKAINAIAGDGGAFFVGTCNGLDSLPSALRRRFRAGIWMFALPDAEERASIGKLHTTKLGLKDDPEFWRRAEGFSGANIFDVCDHSYALACSLTEASEFVVPAAMQEAEGLDKLQRMADGRLLSASYPGKYKIKTPTAVDPVKRGRRLDLEN